MRVTAIIHLDNLRHNVALVKQLIGPKVAISAAVKADAYGHGAIEVSKALIREGVSCLGVAAPSEGRELREVGIIRPIIVYSLPVREEVETIIRYDLTACVSDRNLINLLNREAGKLKKKVSLHLKIDTGMGRIGCRPEEAYALAAAAAESEWLTLAGTFTHFPIADGKDPSPTLAQPAGGGPGGGGGGGGDDGGRLAPAPPVRAGKPQAGGGTVSAGGGGD